ncbi:Glucan-binding domain-containing protein (YG repeat) [Granulicatella balaenopterae]|uniref:Glucan-binding domain-containing protein (YG repeat) n=1 Tax=Granulicatella balaenopterae TaxID=137733 RepID=A0A1H9NU46_9LACT|nr:N-acetylmuramoyl-L-alanine amidase family protein [Granulicatella balaenopterae]SER39129.1 Glucan-binding domain-containing protein (YG repeat) [Granulicatella balaenopterae]
MSYKRKLLTIGSTVMLTTGLVTLTQLEAQQVEAREEVGEDHDLLEGKTSKGYDVSVRLMPKIWEEWHKDGVADIITVTVDAAGKDLNGEKVTLKLADGQETTGKVIKTNEGNKAILWNSLNISKGDTLTVFIGEDESNTKEFIVQKDLKGDCENNVNFNLTTKEGQSITITSITENFICGEADFIIDGEDYNGAPKKTIRLYIESPDGERAIFDVEDTNQYDYKGGNKFEFENHLNIKKGDTIKIGYWTLSDNPAQIGTISNLDSPKFTDNAATFEAPITVKGTNFYNTPTDFSDLYIGVVSDNKLEGQITKITSQYVEGQVDPSYAGAIITFSERGGSMMISVYTRSLVDKDGKFKVYNNMKSFGAEIELTKDGESKYARMMLRPENRYFYRWEQLSSCSRFERQRGWIYKPENIEVPTQKDNEIFEPTSSRVNKKNEITIKDIKDAISIKGYDKEYTIEVDETTIPKLTDGNKEASGEVKATVIYADKSTDEIKVKAIVTSKTDAEIYTIVECGHAGTGVFYEPITPENLKHIRLLSEGDTEIYEGKRSYEIDESTIPVLPEHSKEPVTGQVKFTITYADGSVGDVWADVKIMPSPWDVLDVIPLWEDTDTLVKNAVFNENEKTITGQFIIADADILVRSFNGQFRGPVYEAHTDANGHFTLENATFVDSYSVTLKIDGEQTRITGDFIVKSDNGGGEVDPTPDPEKPVTPTNKTGWDGDSYYIDGEKVTSKWLEVTAKDAKDDETTYWYYFDENGQYVTNTWKGSYYLKDNGQMAKNQWIYDKSYENWFFINEDGTYARYTWKGSYYLKQWGQMAKQEWAYSPETGWHYFNPDGTYVQNKWVGAYYIKQWGYMATNEWIFDKDYDNWFFIKEDGTYAHDTWKGSYYLKQYGRMAHNEWAYSPETGWHYFNPDGTYVQNKWVGDYYLKQWGYMAKNEWIYDKGHWYYVKDNGQYARNEVVDGYKLNASGQMM